MVHLTVWMTAESLADLKEQNLVVLSDNQMADRTEYSMALWLVDPMVDS